MNVLSPSPRRRRPHPPQAGVSLIELMIALVIGAIVILAVVQVFIGSQRNFRANDSLSRVQEVGRFALEDLQHEIRMTGHMGCVNGPSRLRNNDLYNHLPGTVNGTVFTGNHWVSDFRLPIQGFEATNTAPGNTLTLATAPATWTPTLPAFLTGKVSAGSDVVVVRYIGPEAIPITAITAGANPTVTIPAANSADLINGEAYALGDCSKVSLIVPTSVATTTFVANGVTGAEPYSASESYVYRVHMVAYYVGTNASGGSSLYRMEMRPNGVAPTIDELHEGVLSLQAAYGWDARAPLPDGAVDAFITGNTLATSVAGTEPASWRVGALKVGLVVEVPRDGRLVADQTPKDVVGVSLVPRPGDPVRGVYETTIAIRNHLFAY